VTASHKLDGLSVTFDDPNLVANAGLVLPGTLAQRLGVREIIDRRVDLSGRVGGANCGIKAMTVISALLAGAEYIDDIDVLRAGGSEAVCGHEVRAPSTIGTWLRAFTWGCQGTGGMSASSTPPPATSSPPHGPRAAAHATPSRW
jgi:hypothetical protein